MSTPTKQYPTPEWMQDLISMFKTAQAHAFILHFNVRDYAVNSTPLVDYLFTVLAKRNVLARYNISEGIQFPAGTAAQMRTKFDKYTGQTAQATDPATAALANLGIGSPVADATSGNKPQLPKSADRALPMLETLLTNAITPDGAGDAAVIVEFAEAIVPNADWAMMSPADRTALVTLERWGSDKRIADSGNIIILITENLSELHPAIRRAAAKFEQIEIKLPDLEQRKAFAQAQIENRELTLEKGLTLDSIAAETAMLSRVHIEDICLRAGEYDNVVTRAMVCQRKHEIIAAEFGEVIETIDPAFGFDDIGGLEHVKNFFAKSVIAPIRKQNLKRCPMGVIMTGPPGTGKSVMAQAVAKESGINCVLLNPAKIFGQYVGSTERNLDRALRAIEAMSPVIVFIDEIDQSVQRNTGGGDSGVSARVFKRLMEFMSDTTHRGKVVFLAATNRPDMMDAALRRPGRFDKSIPFLVPNETERADIFRVMSKRYLGKAVVATSVLPLTQNWTGAEIEGACVKAAEIVEDEELEPKAALEQAVKRFRPNTQAKEYMTLLAIRECNDVDLLPKEWADKLANREALDAKIAELKPSTGARSAREL